MSLYIKYNSSKAEAAMTRSYIEVPTTSEAEVRLIEEDPLTRFVSLLKEKHNSSKQTTEYNLTLLHNLIKKRKIQKASIIWNQENIAKIYGFRVDDNGKIGYDIVGNNSPEKKTKQYVLSSPSINMSAVKKAILRSKQQTST